MYVCALVFGRPSGCRINRASETAFESWRRIKQTSFDAAYVCTLTRRRPGLAWCLLPVYAGMRKFSRRGAQQARTVANEREHCDADSVASSADDETAAALLQFAELTCATRASARDVFTCAVHACEYVADSKFGPSFRMRKKRCPMQRPL